MAYYKAFDKDLKCRGMQYKIGKEYKMDNTPVVCDRGFHFCDNIADCYSFYPKDKNTRICEVEPLGEIDENSGDYGTLPKKYCTNHIRIIREIEDPMSRTNIYKENSGCLNTGKHNMGHKNCGDSNFGNTNTGSENKGSCNTGWVNIGHYNTGRGNIGDFNTGSYNQGDCNSGNFNIGNGNSGWRNRGRFNSGSWNIGNNNTGVFNTNRQSTIKMFDKESNWTYDDWLNSKAYRIMLDCPLEADIYFMNFAYMTELTEGGKAELIKEYPEAEHINGFIRVEDHCDKDRQAWWDGLSKKDKQEILNLPNFDKDKFKACTGITPILSKLDDADTALKDVEHVDDGNF